MCRRPSFKSCEVPFRDAEMCLLRGCDGRGFRHVADLPRLATGRSPAVGPRRRSPNAPPVEVPPWLADTFTRIVARATEAALAAPPKAARQPTTPPDDRATHVTPSGSLPPVPADAVLSGTMQMSSKDFASKSGEILTQGAAESCAAESRAAAAPQAFDTVQLDKPPAAPPPPAESKPGTGSTPPSARPTLAIRRRRTCSTRRRSLRR